MGGQDIQYDPKRQLPDERIPLWDPRAYPTDVGRPGDAPPEETSPMTLLWVGGVSWIGILLSSAVQAGTPGPTGWQMPELLTPQFYTRSDVSARARENGKPALVAIKSHDCDYHAEKHCLKETYYLADPCNL